MGNTFFLLIELNKVRINGKVSDGDHSKTMEKWTSENKYSLICAHNIEPTYLYNTDLTGLFYNKPPNDSFMNNPDANNASVCK